MINKSIVKSIIYSKLRHGGIDIANNEDEPITRHDILSRNKNLPRVVTAQNQNFLGTLEIESSSEDDFIENLEQKLRKKIGKYTSALDLLQKMKLKLGKTTKLKGFQLFKK